MKRAAKIYTALIFVFLFAPIVILLVFSFNEAKSLSVFSGFSFKWYQELFRDGETLNALKNTLILAVVASLVSTAMGTAAAVGMNRMRNKYLRAALDTATDIPMMNPDIITGISLMLMFVFFGRLLGASTSLGFWSMLAAHITFCLPYVIMQVLPKLQQMDRSLPEAAMDLGCTPVRAFFRVEVPEILPGIITGMIMAFTLSLDDFVISYFTQGSGFQTLPIRIYNMTKKTVTPKMYALATIIFFVILALLLIVSAAGCSITELTRQKTGEITLPKKTQTAQVETTTNITPQADAWREANLPTEYDLLGCCDFVDWFILLTGSKAPGSSENTGYTAFQAFVVQKDGEDYTLAAWNGTSEWDSSVGFMVHTLVTNDRTVIYGFTTDTVFGVWDQENRHDVSFDEITVTFQDSSIPLTRSIDPGKPFLTFSEGTRSIADISFSDGERTANWSDVSGDGLNEPSEPLDCAPLLSKKSSCTTSLPTPASSMFGLTGREAVLFDAAVAQRYPRDDNDIVLPSLREYGSFEENGKTVVICDLHYDFYYDYTGPDWEWNGGAMNTYLRAELETQDGAEVCTGFEIFPGGSPSDWISGECGPLAMQNADGAWVLPEAAGDWFPAVENPFQQYLEVIASTAPSSDAPAAASLSEDMIWEYVHEKLDYAHWAQDMTAEYEDIVRKFQIEDSKMSDLPGDISQWPRYYSAFIDYFSAANADLRYLDADTIWTKGLSEDQQSLIVTMTRADVVLTLSYSLQTSQITEVSTRRNAVLQSVTGDSITAEHITLLNASLEEDLQTLKALNIPPQNYWYGYYRVDSGELYTYKVDPNTSVTIYDIEQEYGAGEDRLYTFKTWRDFVAAAQENEGLLVQPYTLTLKNGVVVKIEEKFYN